MPENPPLFYRQHIFCCTNRRAVGHAKGCCGSKGSEKLRHYMKTRVKELGLKDVRVNSAGCLDRCAAGPCLVIYPEGIWYRVENEDDVDAIIATHLQQGQRVTRLFL